MSELDGCILPIYSNMQYFTTKEYSPSYVRNVTLSNEIFELVEDLVEDLSSLKEALLIGSFFSSEDDSLLKESCCVFARRQLLALPLPSRLSRPLIADRSEQSIEQSK